MATGAGLTGCGEDPDAGTNGVGKLPATKIQSRTKAAAKSADTVRLSGTVVTNGRTYKLDMRLAKDGGTGSVTLKGSTFRLLRVGEHLFLKAGVGFWSQADGEGGGEGDGESDAAAADKLAGQVREGPGRMTRPTSASAASPTRTCCWTACSPCTATSCTDGHHEQSGIRTIRITGDKGSGGTLDVSLEGTPYPLRLVRAGDAGTIRLTDWGEDFPLKAPTGQEAVDYGKQLPSS